MNNTVSNTNVSVIFDYQAFWIDRINFLNKTISQYGLGFIWLVGNLGLVFTCIVFSQPTFRQSSCPMYFIAASLSQFFTFNFALFNRMLQFGYGIDTVTKILWFCKIRFYLFYIFIAIPRYNLILASVDRYFASSCNPRRRQWSSPKIAFRIIIVNIILWCLIYIQVLVFYDIEKGQCLPRLGSYATFFSFYIAIDSGILPILLIFIFGLLTIRNIHQSKRRIVTDASMNRMSRRDNQLYRMLSNQILIFIILNLMNPCYLLYQSFTIGTEKSSVRVAAETFASNMTYVLVYLGFALTFPNFFVSSDIFRREFLRFLQTKILRRPLQTVRSRAANRTDGARSGPELKPVSNRTKAKTESQICS